MAKDEKKDYLLDLASFMVGLRLRSSSMGSVESLAESLCVSRQTLDAYLNGRRAPTMKFLEQYVQELAPADTYNLEKARMLLEAAMKLQREIKLRQLAPDSHSVSVDESSDSPETEYVLTTFYRDNAEFYAAAARSVANAQSALKFTYLRQTLPSQVVSQEAADYFARILEWSTESAVRSALRIIGIPMDADRPRPSMLDWMQEHAAATSNLTNYEFRVVPWYRNGDGLNMALIDDHTSFLAVSGESRQKLDGLSFSSNRVNRYLSTHFTQLWLVAEQSDDFLARCSTN